MRQSSGERPGAPVGIVAALATEARALGPATRRSDGIAALADGTLLAVSGMGCVAAAESARALVAAGCGALASWGVAGGLDPALVCGAILLPEEVLLEAGAPLRTAAVWRERVQRSLGPRWPATGGRLLTCGHPLGSVAEKAMAFGNTRAIAVDMESYAIGEVAVARGVPFIVVRVIVDTARDELPPALAGVMDSGGQVSAARLIGRLVLQPARLGSLLRLARRYGAAQRSLRRIARSGALAAHSVADHSPGAGTP